MLRKILIKNLKIRVILIDVFIIIFIIRQRKVQIQNRIYLQCLNEFHIGHCRHEEPLLWTGQYLHDFFLTACLAPYILHIQQQINWSECWVCLAHILYVINQWSGRKSSLLSFNRIIDTTYFFFWRVIVLRMSSS